MREIRFRAFFKEYGDPERPNGSMFYDIIPSGGFDRWLIAFDGKENGYDGDFAVGRDIEVMQYTGLKDKNGVEIYEGDILKNDTYTTPSTVRSEMQWNCSCCESIYGWQIDGGSNTIIGNIYENPELINLQKHE